MTIRTRLTLWYSALLATVIVVFGVSLFTLLNWAWYSQLQDNMRLVAQQMMEAINLDATGQIAQTPVQKRLAQMPLVSFGLQIWDSSGVRRIAYTENVSELSAPIDPENLSSREPVTRERYVGEIHALVSTVPIVDVRTGQRAGTMQILSPLTTLEAATERLVRVMMGVGIVALVLSFMVGSVIAGQALQPIDTIGQTAKQITAADDLSRRIPYDGPPDELGQLTITFNTTLERLERLFNAQRRFVADVSHELRTPLTTIQGNLDMIKRFGPEQESLDAIESEAQRMARLVGDLLLLAHADSGRLPLREEPLELGSLAYEVYRQAQVLSGEVALKLGHIDAVRISGDADRLKQLMLNLLTNAFKYTPDGGRVTLSVAHEGEFAFLRIADTGEGIPADDLPHIFDRFYRVDKARARQMGGAGLGLSIVKWIAEAHRGRVWAESELGKGTTFTVQFPSLDADTETASTRVTRVRNPIARRLRPEETLAKSSITDLRRK
jgi:heavy metal sensor kinase